MIIGRQQTGRRSLYPIKENFNVTLAGRKPPAPPPACRPHPQHPTDR